MHGAGHGWWAWVIIRGAGGLFRLALGYGRSMKRNRNLINYSSQEYVQNNFLVKLFIFYKFNCKGGFFSKYILSYLILSLILSYLRLSPDNIVKIERKLQIVFKFDFVKE